MQRLGWSMAGERHGHSAKRAIALIRRIYADYQPTNAVPSEKFMWVVEPHAPGRHATHLDSSAA